MESQGAEPTSERTPAGEFILPDVLGPGLRVVFCGAAAGTVSAARGCYYAHPQNRFWRALHAVGLTPYRLDPAEFASLPRWGLGLTDIAKRVSGMDRQLPSGALGREPCRAMAAKIALARPAILAFTSLTAGRRYLGRGAGFGEQPETIGPTRIWLLPSPSPAANWNWEEAWWRALAAAAAGSAPLSAQERGEDENRAFRLPLPASSAGRGAVRGPGD